MAVLQWPREIGAGGWVPWARGVAGSHGIVGRGCVHVGVHVMAARVHARACVCVCARVHLAWRGAACQFEITWHAEGCVRAPCPGAFPWSSSARVPLWRCVVALGTC